MASPRNPRQPVNYRPMHGGTGYPEDMDVKRVKLKVSRRELEQMSTEEVLALVKSERKKYKQARKEKKKELRRRKREESGSILPFDLDIGAIAISIIASVIVIVGSVFLVNWLLDSGPPPELGTIENRAFAFFGEDLDQHEMVQSAGFASVSGQWADEEYEASIAGIDELIQEAGDDQGLIKELELLKLHGIARSGDLDRAISYSRTLQSRHGEDSEFMNYIYWYRGQMYYAEEQPYDAYRSFRNVGRYQGYKAEEALEYVDYISRNYL